MSKIELLATHNRNFIWRSSLGLVKVKAMSTSHLKATVQILEWRVQRGKAYSFPPTHPMTRRHDRNQRALKVMQAELEWRTRNGI